MKGEVKSMKGTGKSKKMPMPAPAAPPMGMSGSGQMGNAPAFKKGGMKKSKKK